MEWICTTSASEREREYRQLAKFQTDISFRQKRIILHFNEMYKFYGLISYLHTRERWPVNQIVNSGFSLASPVASFSGGMRAKKSIRRKQETHAWWGQVHWAGIGFRSIFFFFYFVGRPHNFLYVAAQINKGALRRSRVLPATRRKESIAFVLFFYVHSSDATQNNAIVTAAKRVCQKRWWS